ncbi:MAG: hypothetical protein ACYC8T_15765 [Myxococcaceae bacterium]
MRGASLRRWLVVGTAALLALGGCRKPAAGAEHKPFWDWVAANSAELSKIERGDEPIADGLAKQLHYIDGDLTFELGPKGAERELIISAGGIQKAFSKVQALVAAAPKLPGWKVIAFRQRKSLDLRIGLGGLELGADELWFTAKPDGRAGLIAVTVFAKGLTAENDREVQQAVYLLLDTAIGEYDVETKLGAIEVKAAPPDPAGQKLTGFRQLPGVVDGWRR